MSKTKSVTVDEAVKQIGSRFDLVLVASERAREIKRGSTPKVPTTSGPIVTALAEIEQGLYTKADYLKKLRSKEKGKWE